MINRINFNTIFSIKASAQQALNYQTQFQKKFNLDLPVNGEFNETDEYLLLNDRPASWIMAFKQQTSLSDELNNLTQNAHDSLQDYGILVNTSGQYEGALIEGKLTTAVLQTFASIDLAQAHPKKVLHLKLKDIQITCLKVEIGYMLVWESAWSRFVLEYLTEQSKLVEKFLQASR